MARNITTEDALRMMRKMNSGEGSNGDNLIIGGRNLLRNSASLIFDDYYFGELYKLLMEHDGVDTLIVSGVELAHDGVDALIIKGATFTYDEDGTVTLS